MSGSKAIFRLLPRRLHLGDTGKILGSQAGGQKHLQRLSLSTSSVVFSDQPSSSAVEDKQQPSFASLFRSSPLVQLGPPEGKVVVGSVIEVVGDDLYIDFGFKFTAVCRRPKVNPENYVRGSSVKVRINDLELSDRFLGSTQDMTLLEADVTLLGLVASPVPPAASNSQSKSSASSSSSSSSETAAA